jgi:hypothetical protein
MDARQAAQNLEVIRTLMERTTQYRLLTARAGIAAGTIAGLGALLFVVLDAGDAWHFGIVWSGVFFLSLLATTLGTIFRGRQRGERVWSRQLRAVLFALTPSLFAALVLSVYFFARGDHLRLPGVWMLCYGQAALAMSAYAPAPVRWLGIGMLLLACVTLWLGQAWAVLMMGLVFGLGHLALGVALLVAERRESAIRLHCSVT